MQKNWYYVENNEQAGPVTEAELHSILKREGQGGETLVWKKGFEGWKKANEVMDWEHVDHHPEVVRSSEQRTMHWDTISKDEKIFILKIGRDRLIQEEIEYGPYSLNIIKKLYKDNRINSKTLIFAPGMDSWIFLADLPNFQDLFMEVPDVIEESDRRSEMRKPFVARVLFHDDSIIYEGLCRDVSIGGLQMMVSDFPIEVGSVITMNVHPDNSEYCFVAEGKVVRILEGRQGFSVTFLGLNDEAQRAIKSYVGI